MARAPPSDVLAAFGITAEPQPLSGGRSLCSRAEDKVLKPADQDDEAQWTSTLISRMIQQLRPAAYTLAQPVPVADRPELFVFKSWTAWALLDGEARSPERIADILRVGRAFHEDIARLKIDKPPFLNHPRNRFEEANLVAWNEKSLDEVANVSQEVYGWFAADLERLRGVKKPFAQDLPQQLIHGDLTGNVLFSDSSPPGIIDMTFYWRPALWAEAIVIADGLAWHRQGRNLVELYGLDEVRLQLLVRALEWRMLCFCIDPDMGFVKAFVPTADYGGAVRVVEELTDGA